MIDNTDVILQYLDFASEDYFYHLQIMKRKKENPDLGSNSYVVKTYYVSSSRYLIDRLREIRALCDFNNARACINLNRRSFEKMAFHLLRKTTDIIMNRDYRSARKAYESVAGTYSDEPNKKWLIDVDGNEDDRYATVQHIRDISPTDDKYLGSILTKNGFHVIASPFNRSLYKLPHAIHKDNPTLLYAP